MGRNAASYESGAEYLFGKAVAVYRLYEDDSEALIEDRDELLRHDGLFGVEKDDWSTHLKIW